MPEVELKHERAKLQRVLRRWDLVFFSVCALIGLDAIAGLAKFGLWQGVTWLVIFVFIFLLPYGLISAELASTFPAEGGIYTWVRMAYGKLPAGFWVTTWETRITSAFSRIASRTTSSELTWAPMLIARKLL